MAHKCIVGPRASGRTTKLIQHVIDWMAENEGQVVIVCGPNERWARAIKEAFYGMPDITIIGPHNADQQLRGRGRNALVAVDNIDLIEPFWTQNRLIQTLELFEHTATVEEGDSLTEAWGFE